MKKIMVALVALGCGLFVSGTMKAGLGSMMKAGASKVVPRFVKSAVNWSNPEHINQPGQVKLGMFNQNEPSLHRALRVHNDPNTVAKNFVEELNRFDNKGATALHYAAAIGDESVVKALVDHNANVDLEYSGDNMHYGQTALYFAVKNNDYDVADILLKKGSNPNIGYTYKNLLSSGNNGRTPLFTAVINKNAEMVNLLVENGADVNVRERSGRGILPYAAKSKDMLQIFFKMGVNLDSRAKEALKNLSNNPRQFSYRAADDVLMKNRERSKKHHKIQTPEQQRQRNNASAADRIELERASYKKARDKKQDSEELARAMVAKRKYEAEYPKIQREKQRAENQQAADIRAGTEQKKRVFSDESDGEFYSQDYLIGKAKRDVAAAEARLEALRDDEPSVSSSPEPEDPQGQKRHLEDLPPLPGQVGPELGGKRSSFP